MHPRSAMLPYQLVERQLQRPYQIKQLPVLCLAAACDVCRLTKPDVKLCSAFNKETRDGLRMGKYSELLGKAIESIVTKKEESDIDSFLDGYVGELF